MQAIPKGQVEAAQSLGLSYWQTQRKIVLPQALAMVVPGIMNIFIGIFKDTSLVTIVSLYELTGALSLALNSDADWRPFKIEGYFFITLIYFIFCFSMSRYSLWIEKRLVRQHEPLSSRPDVAMAEHHHRIRQSQQVVWQQLPRAARHRPDASPRVSAS